jgi:hypothetical protein
VAAAPARGPDPAALAAGVGGGVLGLFVFALVAVIMLRAMQTRRRLRHGDPPGQVIGAWDEVLDALALAGRAPPRNLAAAEVAAYAALVVASGPARLHTRHPRPPAPPLDELAGTVNAVAFAGRSVPGPDATDADSARDRAVAYTRALYARRSWWRRLLWRIDPRPLRRRR